MSYCVNCGVELDASIKACPLCKTPVINPNIIQNAETIFPFPKNKTVVETANRKDVGILLSSIFFAIAFVFGMLNLLVFSAVPWSVTIIGGCVLLWVITVPPILNRKQSGFVSILFDGVATMIYLYLISFLTGSNAWLWEVAIPIVLWSIVVAELIMVCVKLFPVSFLSSALYCVSALGIYCVGLEMILDLFIQKKINLQWSTVVLSVCVIVVILLVTVLSRRRLRNEVRRRLHF